MEKKKEAILDALSRFIRQRPGIDFEDYRTSDYAESVRAYRQDCHQVSRQLRDAQTLLRAVSWRDSITAEELLEGFSKGRLTCAMVSEDQACFDYCQFQNYPTEYRGAAARALATILWNHAREDYKTGDALRAYFKKEFGRGLAARYFD